MLAAVPCSTYYMMNAQVSSTDARFSDQITVTCDVGYMFNNSESSTTKVMNCSDTGTWVGDNTHCTGMLSFSRIQLLFRGPSNTTTIQGMQSTAIVEKNQDVAYFSG